MFLKVWRVRKEENGTQKIKGWEEEKKNGERGDKC